MLTHARFTAPTSPIQYPHRERVTVTQALARRLGCTEASAHKRLYAHPRLADLTAHAIHAYAEAQDWRGLAAFCAPVDAALELAARAPTLGPSLVVDSQRVDLAEDERESAHLSAPTRETAQAWVRSIDAERGALLTLRQALVEHWGLA
ncbi:MAG TPA: hypothetical protein VNL98_06720 [Gemmatimonadales bacterium]|nr:hypothetical protein [Gemmatimonadales bacterium]